MTIGECNCSMCGDGSDDRYYSPADGVLRVSGPVDFRVKAPYVSSAILPITDYGVELRRSAALQDMDAKIKALELRIAELESENKDPYTARILMRRVFGQDRDW